MTNNQFFIVMILMFISIQEGFTSGSTQATQVGEYYSLTIETPSMVFHTDPETGQSPEQNYHRQAKLQFEMLLKDNEEKIKSKIEAIRREFKEKISILPFKSTYPVWNEYMNATEIPKGAVQISFFSNFPEMGSLILVFDKAPSKELYEQLRTRIRELFKPD